MAQRENRGVVGNESANEDLQSQVAEQIPLARILTIDGGLFIDRSVEREVIARALREDRDAR